MLGLPVSLPEHEKYDVELGPLFTSGVLAVVYGLFTRRPLAVAAGDRLRIQLTLRDTSVVLEGRLRHPFKPVRLGGGTVRAGVQFKTLTDSRDDRQSLGHLNKIVTELQRESIRRRKLGAA